MILSIALRKFFLVCVGGMVFLTLTSTLAQSPTAPVISNLPASLILDYGTSLYLNPEIAGTQPITYQWRQDGNPLRSTSPAGDAIDNTSWWYREHVTQNDAGQYILTATNEAGSTSSTPVTVTVNPAIPPVINQLTGPFTIDYGTGFYLSMDATGSQPLTYRWAKDGVDVPNPTPLYGVMYLSYATTADSGEYIMTAENAAGVVTSSPISVIINPAVAPDIGMPATVTVPYGERFDLYPVITGTQPMTFQWKKNGTPLSDGTTNSYSRNSATAADSGLYTLTATNFVGTATSAAIKVTVNAPVSPVITEQPSSLSITQGLSAVFNVTAHSPYPIFYQWYVGDQAIVGATNAVLVVPAVQPANTGNFKVVLTNSIGSTTSNIAVLSISPALGVVSASARGNNSFYIKSDGTLWAMGQNDSGQLGDGTTNIRYNPRLIATGVASVTAGSYNSEFIKLDGTLWAMGGNFGGVLGDGTTTDQLKPVPIATDVVAAAVGSRHSLFIKSDGTLWSVGANNAGMLGDGTTTDRSTPIQIATGVKTIATGEYHSFFVKFDGSLWGMGFNEFGELGDGTFTNQNTPVLVAVDVESVGANMQSLFIKTDGSLWAMGWNVLGQLGDGTDLTRNSPVRIADSVRSVAAGGSHSLFIKADGTLWGTGYNGEGQLGDGTNTYNHPHSPGQIESGVMSVTAGDYHTMFIKLDGSLWAMGANNNGQLGDGQTNSPKSPELIASGPLLPPAMPTGVAATNGVLDRMVRLSWHPTIGATEYEVWRNTTNDFTSATRIATAVPISLYYDLTAAPATMHYYWVKALNPAGASSLSVAVPAIVPPSNAVITFTIE